jgi:hypothetical protein
MSIVPKRIFARLLIEKSIQLYKLLRGWEITNIWIYFQLLNNFKKIMDLLKRKGVFLFVIASPPKAGVAISFLGRTRLLRYRSQ